MQKKIDELRLHGFKVVAQKSCLASLTFRILKSEILTNSGFVLDSHQELGNDQICFECKEGSKTSTSQTSWSFTMDLVTDLLHKNEPDPLTLRLTFSRKFHSAKS